MPASEISVTLLKGLGGPWSFQTALLFGATLGGSFQKAYVREYVVFFWLMWGFLSKSKMIFLVFKMYCSCILKQAIRCNMFIYIVIRHMVWVL